MSYFGSKNGSGSFQQIVNEIPPIECMYIGFLGNCPIFRFFRDRIDTIGYEISKKVIDKYWSDSPEGIVNSDFIEDLPKLLLSMLAKGKIFLYLDPPYLLETRKDKRPVYQYEMSWHRHKQLLHQVKDFPGYVAISCYDNQLYSSTLDQWRKKSWKVATRNGAAIETLYMNYPEPKELFTYDFLGVNHTDRQRIRRKLERIQNKLRQLPHLERMAILNHLQNSKF